MTDLKKQFISKLICECLNMVRSEEMREMINIPNKELENLCRQAYDLPPRKKGDGYLGEGEGEAGEELISKIDQDINVFLKSE